MKRNILIVILVLSFNFSFSFPQNKETIELFSIAEGRNDDPETIINRSKNDESIPLIPVKTIQETKASLEPLVENLKAEEGDESSQAAITNAKFESRQEIMNISQNHLDFIKFSNNTFVGLCKSQSNNSNIFVNEILPNAITTIEKFSSERNNKIQEMNENSKIFQKRDEKIQETILEALRLVQEQLHTEKEIRAKGVHMRLFNALLDKMESKLLNASKLISDLSKKVSVKTEHQLNSSVHYDNVMSCSQCDIGLTKVQNLIENLKINSIKQNNECNITKNSFTEEIRKIEAQISISREDFSILETQHIYQESSRNKREIITQIAKDQIGDLEDELSNHLVASQQNKGVCEGKWDQSSLRFHNQKSIRSALLGCGLECEEKGASQIACVTNCVQELRVSFECGVCLSGYTGCISIACASQCSKLHSDECEKCLESEKRCSNRLDACKVFSSSPEKKF
eukprot:c7455_g1_i1.p1 GENE.c7455_g1_i1~~c7455_g1_i1.p1  ORF type:complete len:457 (+),score=167.00 c7455_g1_i1:72-1442(+)